MTRGQKKTVRKALRRYGRGACEATPEAWREVVEETLDYYDHADPVCARLLRLRYLEDQPEERNVRFSGWFLRCYISASSFSSCSWE